MTCFLLHFIVICERKVICATNIRDTFLYYPEKAVNPTDDVYTLSDQYVIILCMECLQTKYSQLSNIINENSSIIVFCLSEKWICGSGIYVSYWKIKVTSKVEYE